MAASTCAGGGGDCGAEVAEEGGGGGSMGEAEAGGGKRCLFVWSCHFGRLSIGLSAGINHGVIDTAAFAVHILDCCANAMAVVAAAAAAASSSSSSSSSSSDLTLHAHTCVFCLIVAFCSL